MKSQPDYKIIDACLEKVVRPEKMMGAGPYWLYRSCTGWYWSTGEWPMPDTTQPDDSDALAVVRDCIMEYLIKTSYCTVEAFAHQHGVQYAASSSGVLAQSIDRTTALCLLALRVAGVNNEQETA